MNNTTQLTMNPEMNTGRTKQSGLPWFHASGSRDGCKKQRVRNHRQPDVQHLKQHGLLRTITPWITEYGPVKGESG